MRRTVRARTAVRVGIGLDDCLLLAGLSFLAERRAEARQPAAMFGMFPAEFVSEVIAGAGSVLRYSLNGLYTNFLADIGPDEEVGSLGPVYFSVYLDGVEVYWSGAMTGRTHTKQINLNVAGKNELRLVVDPLGSSGTRWNKAGWANARLT